MESLKAEQAAGPRSSSIRDTSSRCLDALITNFHLPESTLLMLVSALAGKEQIMHAYEVAVQERYRFFRFGDAMFIS